MANVAYLPIQVDRYGAAVRQIYIKGLDLSGIAMRAQVRLGGDVPGAPLVDLQTVANGNAEGLRLVDVTTDAGGLPTSHVEMVINETTIEALPYSGELGSPLVSPGTGRSPWRAASSASPRVNLSSPVTASRAPTMPPSIGQRDGRRAFPLLLACVPARR